MIIDTSNGNFIIDTSIDKEPLNKRLYRLSNGDIFNSSNMTLEFEDGMLYGVANTYLHGYVRTGISFTPQELNIISNRLAKWNIL